MRYQLHQGDVAVFAITNKRSLEFHADGWGAKVLSTDGIVSVTGGNLSLNYGGTEGVRIGCGGETTDDET